MNLIYAGLNHRTAPLEVREAMWFSDDQVREFLRSSSEDFSECFVLSTCNRTEVFGVPHAVNGSGVQPFIDRLIDRMQYFKKADALVRREHFYSGNTEEAATHLFTVAAGADSMVLGDVQILKQLRESYHLAREANRTGAVLHRLIQTASRVGKRTRNETDLGVGAVSVSYAAVELAVKIFNDLRAKSVLLIGAGQTGELTAKHLVAREVGSMYIANRTLSNAEELAGPLGATVVPWDRLLSSLADVDIVISSVTSPGYVLTKTDLAKATEGRHRSLLVIDIGVPRNVEPSANELEGIFLNDLDSLQNIVDQSLRRRQSELPKVKAIVLEELKDFMEWNDSLGVVPTIRELRSMFETVRQEEVTRVAHRFSDDEHQALDAVTKRIINRLLHQPTVGLRNGENRTDEETHQTLDTVRRLFGLKSNPAVEPQIESDLE